jgi:hypothetical protein
LQKEHADCKGKRRLQKNTPIAKGNADCKRTRRLQRETPIAKRTRRLQKKTPDELTSGVRLLFVVSA